MDKFIGEVLKLNHNMSCEINDITEKNIVLDNHNINVIMMYTDNGIYRIPLHLRKQISVGKSYVIKSILYDRQKVYGTCQVCKGKGCKECNNTGYELIIIYKANEIK